MRYLVVRTENLTKFFGHCRGVEDLTIGVEPGQVYGVLGPQGAGKSTLLRLLMDLIRPTRGHALLLGMDVHHQKMTVQRRVGYLPAEFGFGRGGTVGALLHGLAKLRGGQAWEAAQGLAERFDLDLATPMVALSALQTQKLGLIQAFMHHPDLVILDEPTRHLDQKAQDVFFRLVSEVRADGGSVLFTSSVLCEMERVCDQVAVLHRGRLLAVERGVQLRARALRRVEMRFAGPVSADVFSHLPNLEQVRLEDNKLRCLLCGDPDPLLKAASQFRVMDILSQQPTLEEVYHSYYGVGAYAG
jgi:ABC-2 type transport system ATP-binding protein